MTYRQQLWGWMRVLALLVSLQLGFGALAVRQVVANVDSALLGTGASMMVVGESLGAEPRTVRLNGARVRLHVQTVHDSTVEEVLGAFRKRCLERNGRLREQLEGDPATEDWSEAQFELFDGVWHAEGDGEDAMACLDTRGEQISPQWIAERADAYLASGDAAVFGDLRYMRAEQEGRDVFLVALWTDGPFNPTEMFPATGDAPGIDFEGLPRPPGGRRLLSAWEEGQAPAVAVYETRAMDKGELEEHYRQVLSDSGWEMLNPPGQGGSREARGLMVMSPGGVTAILAMSDAGNGRSMVSVAPMDVRGATRPIAP